MDIKELRQAYNRFKINYRNRDGGINLYAGYDKDLEIIMQWVGDELIELTEVRRDNEGRNESYDSKII